MTLSKIKIYFILLFLLVLSGCAHYSFKGALPSYLKTISIPIFDDQSAWPGLQEDLTNRLVDTFIENNSLQVIDDENSADLVLKGTITSVQERYPNITQQENVEETQMWVNVRVQCINSHTKKPLWSGSLSNFGTLSGAGTLDQKNAAVSEAVDKLVIDILNKTIGAW